MIPSLLMGEGQGGGEELERGGNAGSYRIQRL